jgi:hypothetical protein
MKSKAMTPEQLLAPRFEVIADYPSSQLRIGDILTQSVNGGYFEGGKDDHGCPIQILETDIYSCTSIFKPLQWWERREASEMPEYYKYSGNHGVFKTSFRINGDIVMLNFSPTETIPVNLAYCLPATKSEYDQYIKSKEK